jgi:hypothetical protein
MSLSVLSTHLDSALALYRQRNQRQQVSLADAHWVARQEKYSGATCMSCPATRPWR